jgi:hypothetical protein
MRLSDDRNSPERKALLLMASIMTYLELMPIDGDDWRRIGMKPPHVPAHHRKP